MAGIPGGSCRAAWTVPRDLLVQKKADTTGTSPAPPSRARTPSPSSSRPSSTAMVWWVPTTTPPATPSAMKPTTRCSGDS